MNRQTFATRNENERQQKELELTQQGYQNTTNERLSPGEYREFNQIAQDTSERIFVIEWMPFELTDQP